MRDYQVDDKSSYELMSDNALLKSYKHSMIVSRTVLIICKRKSLTQKQMIFSYYLHTYLDSYFINYNSFWECVLQECRLLFIKLMIVEFF